MVLTCENTTAEQQQEQQELHRAHGEPWMLLILFLFLPSPLHLFTTTSEGEWAFWLGPSFIQSVASSWGKRFRNLRANCQRSKGERSRSSLHSKHCSALVAGSPRRQKTEHILEISYYPSCWVGFFSQFWKQHLSATAFHSIFKDISHVYTGKLKMHKSEWEEMMILAACFRHRCWEYFRTSEITVRFRHLPFTGRRMKSFFFFSTFFFLFFYTFFFYMLF